MKKIVFLMLIVAFNFSCTPLKRAQTNFARSVAGSDVIKIGNHEAYCSQGQVCSEVDVLAISFDKEHDDVVDTVKVVLKNRTDRNALVRIRLQITESDGRQVETRPELFSIPPTEEKTYKMPGVYKKGAKVRVLLNAAR